MLELELSIDVGGELKNDYSPFVWGVRRYCILKYDNLYWDLKLFAKGYI